MRKEMDLLKKQKDITKPDSLKNNIVISGLPMDQITDKESVTKTVIKILKKLNMDLKPEDVECYKIGKDNGKQIKVSFLNIDNKNSVMEAKKNILLKATDFDFDENKTIYINIDITIKNQLLLKKARELKKSNMIKYAWYKD
ncbi:hypothetical protein HHI36_009866, partial [Cryptolaemus montrouzieri]